MNKEPRPKTLLQWAFTALLILFGAYLFFSLFGMLFGWVLTGAAVVGGLWMIRKGWHRLQRGFRNADKNKTSPALDSDVEQELEQLKHKTRQNRETG